FDRKEQDGPEHIESGGLDGISSPDPRLVKDARYVRLQRFSLEGLHREIASRDTTATVGFESLVSSLIEIKKLDLRESGLERDLGLDLLEAIRQDYQAEPSALHDLDN